MALAKKDRYKYCYYEIYQNFHRDTSWGDAWEKTLTRLSADDAYYAACVVGPMKKDRVRKLIAHPSRKFDCMRMRKMEVHKVFTDEPVEFWDYHEQSRERTEKLLALHREEIDAYVKAQAGTVDVPQIPIKQTDGESSTGAGL